MIKKIIVSLCLGLLLTGGMLSAIKVGLNDDVHFDFPNAVANDFHIQGIIHSGGGITPVLKEILVFGDPGTGNWTVSGKDLTQIGPEDWFFKADFVTDGYISYCQWIHFGFKFDVEAYNIIANLVGWWTKDGIPLEMGDNGRDVSNYMQVPVTGFEVTGNSAIEPRLRITNSTNRNVLMETLELAVSPKDIPLEHMYSTGLGRPGEPSPLYPDLKWVKVPQFPITLKPDSFFDVFLINLPIQMGPGSFLLMRGRQIGDNDTTPANRAADWGWFWEIHEEPVITPNLPPNALFTADVNAMSAQFNDFSTDIDGTVVTWHWDFADGSISNAQNPFHTFATTGVFPVKLQVTDDDGATDTFSATITVPAGNQWVAVGLNDDVHFDYQGLKANDFHIQGTIHSSGGIAPVVKEIMVFGDPGTGNWTVQNYTLAAVGVEDWYFSADFVTDGYIQFCQWIHFGIKFDVQAKNIIANLKGYWTLDGNPLIIPGKDVNQYRQVAITGFEVTEKEGKEFFIISNSTNLVIEIPAFELAISKEEIPLKHMFTTGLGRPGEESPLYPNLKWKTVPLSVAALQPGQSFTISLEAVGITIPSGCFLLSRGQQLMVDSTVPRTAPDWGWFWEQHQAVIKTCPKDDLVGSFPGMGIWARYSDSAAWERYSIKEAQLIRTGDINGNGIDDAVIRFKTPNELWIRFDNGIWKKLQASVDTLIWFDVADMNNDGYADLIGSWNSGVWYCDLVNQSWHRYSNNPAKMLTAADFDGDGRDDFIGVWGDIGIWVRYSGSGVWKKIMEHKSIQDLCSGEMTGDTIFEMVGNWDIGVWQYELPTQIWTRLHKDTATEIAVGDMNGLCLGDLIGNWPKTAGLWVRYSENGLWQKFSNFVVETMDTGNLR